MPYLDTPVRPGKRPEPSKRQGKPEGDPEPDTGVQYLALRHLERIAEDQAAAIASGTSAADLSGDFFPARLPAGYVDPASFAEPATQAPRTGLAVHRRRFTAFSLIGALVLVLGIGVQYLLYRKLHAGNSGSYWGQAIFSIELSFLLNHTITWRDRNVGLGAALIRFNLQKLVLTIPNYLLFILLVKLGMNWLMANLGTTAVFTVLNYVTGDLWAFAASNAAKVRERIRLSRPFPAITAQLPVLTDLAALPTVSIVIPCKGNERTIRATVEALLRQDYPALVELILVGDVDDSTWTVLRDITDRRLVLLEQEQTPGRRDPNVKRAKGLRYASGQVLALADSDIVMDSNWLSQGVRLLYQQGSGLVAGGMRAVNDTFWGRFVDRNALAAKTPRIPQPYNVTAANFGKKGFKPPITANALFTRDLYGKCELDTAWAYGYEDYEWFWRVAKNGHAILYSGDLTAAHHHRSSFKRLLREYRQSSTGCARFVHVHRDSPLAKKRLLQASFLPLVALAGLAGVGLAAGKGYGLYVLLAGLLGMLLLSIREVINARSLEAAVYPPLSMLLALTFTFNLALNLIKVPLQDPAVRPPPAMTADGRTTKHTRRTLILLAAVLIIGAAARLVNIANMPEWQLDEITYWSIGRNLTLFKTLNVPLAWHQTWQPFLYHPPFYMFLLNDWFHLVGVGITQARVLGSIAEMLAFVLLARMLTRLYGAMPTAFAMPLIVFDGWLLYVGRISYIEDTCLLIMMVGLNIYVRALRTGGMGSYIATGAIIGFASIYNNDAGYLIVVLVVHWLMIRRDTRQHIAAVASAVMMIATYVFAMIKLYTINGQNWWWHDTYVQLSRLTGGQASAGTTSSPTQLLMLMTKQYSLFVPSVVIVGAALTLLILRLAYCGRERSFAPLGQERLLPAWAATAIGIYGPAGLHFSQYFVMILLPLYAYLWVNVWQWLVERRPHIVPAFMAGVVFLGCVSAALRLHGDSNAFRQFQQYAATRIPSNALVIAGTAGDPLAYLVNQNWCSPGTSLSDECFNKASYLVTWGTYLQSANPLNLQKLTVLLSESKAVANFHQFSGTITVWKIDRTRQSGPKGIR